MKTKAILLVALSAFAAGCGGSASNLQIPVEAESALRSVSSPGGRHVALLHLAPLRLRLYDARAKLLKEWRDPFSAEDAACLQIRFLSDDDLLLCLPAGALRHVVIPSDPRSAVVGPEIRIDPGCFTAVTASRAGDVVWLAADGKVTGYQTETGARLAVLDPGFHPVPGQTSTGPIMTLWLVDEEKTLVVGLYDSRTVTMPLPAVRGAKP